MVLEGMEVFNEFLLVEGGFLPFFIDLEEGLEGELREGLGGDGFIVFFGDGYIETIKYNKLNKMK